MGNRMDFAANTSHAFCTTSLVKLKKQIMLQGYRVLSSINIAFLDLVCYEDNYFHFLAHYTI